nr:MAG TPA: hypothetical protein [Caudoviricetes sp.]
MFEIVAEIVESGHAEELSKIIEQYEIDVSKRKENEKNERI